MSARVWPQPLLVVRDVPRSREFYCAVLGGESGHGGHEYEQILVEGELVHPNAKQRELWLRDPDGYAVVLAGESEYRPRG